MLTPPTGFCSTETWKMRLFLPAASRSHRLRGWQVSFSEVSDWNSLPVWPKSIHSSCSGIYSGVFPSFFKLCFCRKAVLTFLNSYAASSQRPMNMPRAVTCPVQEGHGPYLVLSRLWLQSACQRKVFLLRHLALFPGPPAVGRTPVHTVPQKPHESAPTSPFHTSWIRGKVHL